MTDLENSLWQILGLPPASTEELLQEILKLKDTKLLLAHKYSINNYHHLKSSVIIGCFYCLKLNVFKTDDENEKFLKRCEWKGNQNQTAFCPDCGIDALIGEASGFLITKDFLKEMQERWFSIPKDWKLSVTKDKLRQDKFTATCERTLNKLKTKEQELVKQLKDIQQLKQHIGGII